MASVAVSIALGVPLDIIKAGIKKQGPVCGRLQKIKDSKGIDIFIDYAHTADALEKVLVTLKNNNTSGRIILVFGCGGERDKEKRPAMGKVAAKYSDWIIITSDNPRNEDPQMIIKDILRGIKQTGIKQIEPKHSLMLNEKGFSVIVDRKEAIKTALRYARRGDTLIFAGKGHERYQDIKGKKIPFDESQEIKRVLKEYAIESTFNY